MFLIFLMSDPFLKYYYRIWDSCCVDLTLPHLDYSNNLSKDMIPLPLLSESQLTTLLPEYYF